MTEEDHPKNKGPTLYQIDPSKITGDEEILDFVNRRLGSISGLEKCTNLKQIYFRKNLFTKIENLNHLTKLEHLELYDNKISKLEGID
jgi:Leucine-rich repeat (LRR) protein